MKRFSSRRSRRRRNRKNRNRKYYRLSRGGIQL